MLGGATCVSEIGPCNASCMVLYVFMCSLVLLCMFYVFLRIFARLCKVSHGFVRFQMIFCSRSDHFMRFCIFLRIFARCGTVLHVLAYFSMFLCSRGDLGR